MQIENKKILHTDILIIGGGTAGCYAALTIREQSDYSIVIAEKQISNEAAVWRPVSMPLMLTLWMEENRKIMWSTQKKMRTAL